MQAAVLAGLVAIVSGPARAQTNVLTPAEARAAKAAFKAIDTDNWKRARRLTARITDPLVVKVIRWLDFTRPNTDASFRHRGLHCRQSGLALPKDPAAPGRGGHGRQDPHR